jgi:hypothetical protein
MARADVWDARAFTQGSEPAEPANTIELEVGTRTTQTFLCEKTKVESVLRLRAARLSSPGLNACLLYTFYKRR